MVAGEAKINRRRRRIKAIQNKYNKESREHSHRLHGIPAIESNHSHLPQTFSTSKPIGSIQVTHFRAISALEGNNASLKPSVRGSNITNQKLNIVKGEATYVKLSVKEHPNVKERQPSSRTPALLVPDVVNDDYTTLLSRKVNLSKSCTETVRKEDIPCMTEICVTKDYDYLEDTSQVNSTLLDSTFIGSNLPSGHAPTADYNLLKPSQIRQQKSSNDGYARLKSQLHNGMTNCPPE